jgi:multiple sugar transport system permease protein
MGGLATSSLHKGSSAHRTKYHRSLLDVGWRERGRRFRSGLVVLVIAVLFAFPFYWVIVTALSNPGVIFDFPPHLLPGLDVKNFSEAWHEAPWVRYFANTVLISACTTFLALATSLLAGFALGIMRYRSREFWFVLVLSMLMIPAMALLVPDYIILKDLHWLNTYQAQIVPFGASVFGIFLIRQVFSTLPNELIEAAELDGVSQWKFLRYIAAPIAKPALITIGIYIFIGSWDAFVWPFIMTSSPSVQPVEVGLASFLGAFGTQWTELSAAVVFTTLPIMIVFMIAQRRLVEGAYSATGAAKG